jgi:hypothetical protein
LNDNDDEEYRCAECQALCCPWETCPGCGSPGGINRPMEPTRLASLDAASDEEIDRMLGGRGESVDRSLKEHIA